MTLDERLKAAMELLIDDGGKPKEVQVGPPLHDEILHSNYAQKMGMFIGQLLPTLGWCTEDGAALLQTFMLVFLTVGIEMGKEQATNELTDFALKSIQKATEAAKVD